jgi:SAM-dependent methyltransferase
MIHRTFADNTNRKSIASQLRQKRFQLFVDMLDKFPSTVNILDIGGTQGYWENLNINPSISGRLKVTLLNLYRQEIRMDDFISVIGDARSMPQFKDKQFDIVYSNSTLEHVGNFEEQKKMAEEIIRIGKRYYIQTPNRYFPIEPHFVFPFFQFLPINVRVWLIQNFRLGWFPKMVDRKRAYTEVNAIRLLTKSEVQALFPEASIFEEKYLGLTKSYIAFN